MNPSGVPASASPAAGQVPVQHSASSADPAAPSSAASSDPSGRGAGADSSGRDGGVLDASGPGVGVAEPDVDPAALDAAPVSRLGRLVDVVLRIIGGILAVLMALLTGLLELYLAPLRVGGTLIGVSVLFSIVANIGLASFAVQAVGVRRAIVLPWVTWTALMFVAAGIRTDEGDQLLSGDNWVGMALVLVGSVAFAGYTYRRILHDAPRR